MKMSPLRRPTTWVAILGLAGAAAYGAGPGRWFDAEGESDVRGTEVKRGPLLISVLQRGNLEARNSAVLKSEVEGQTTILFMIPEGTIVEKGTLVAELDTANLVDRRITQEVVVQNARASYTKAVQELEIQKSQNESDM